MSARTRALLPRRRTATATAVLLLGALGLAGCTDDAAGPPDPPATTAAAAGRPGRARPSACAGSPTRSRATTTWSPSSTALRGEPGHRRSPGAPATRRWPSSAARARCPTSSWSRAATSPTFQAEARSSRSTSSSTRAASTSATSTPATRCGRSASTTGCSACPTASRRWSIYYNTELVDFEQMAGPRAAGARVGRVHDAAHALDLRAVQRRRGVRDQAAPGDRGLYDRAHPARARAVHRRRRRQRLRRRRPTRPRWPSPPTTAGRRSRRTLALLRDAQAHPQPRAARGEAGAGLVQGGQARDDRRLPRAGARAAQGAGPGVRRDADAGHRRPPARSATSPASASRPTPRTSPRPPTSWSTSLDGALGHRGGPRRLPGAGQRRGRAVRRLPPAGPAAGQQPDLQHRRARHLHPAAARPRGRARGRRAARDRGAGRRRADPPAGDDRRASPRRSTRSRRPSSTPRTAITRAPSG